MLSMSMSTQETWAGAQEKQPALDRGAAVARIPHVAGKRCSAGGTRVHGRHGTVEIETRLRDPGSTARSPPVKLTQRGLVPHAETDAGRFRDVQLTQNCARPSNCAVATSRLLHDRRDPESAGAGHIDDRAPSTSLPIVSTESNDATHWPKLDSRPKGAAR